MTKRREKSFPYFPPPNLTASINLGSAMHPAVGSAAYTQVCLIVGGYSKNKNRLISCDSEKRILCAISRKTLRGYSIGFFPLSVYCFFRLSLPVSFLVPFLPISHFPSFFLSFFLPSFHHNDYAKRT